MERSNATALQLAHAKASLSLEEATLALHGGDFASAWRTCREGARVLSQVPQAASQWWQSEARARLAVLGMGALSAMGNQTEHKAWCADMHQALSPALASGHAGVVLEASLHLQACTGSRMPTPEDWQRLSAGGYRAAWAGIFPVNNQP